MTDKCPTSKTQMDGLERFLIVASVYVRLASVCEEVVTKRAFQALLYLYL